METDILTTLDPDDEKIKRANLDGTGSETVHTSLGGGPGDPHGLALDTQAHKLYWVEVDSDKIYRLEILRAGQPLAGSPGSLEKSSNRWKIFMDSLEANWSSRKASYKNGIS